MNSTLDTIRSLRSIHGNFSERDVSREDVEAILEHGVRAATASGRQNYSIVVISGRERVFELFGYRGSRALLFCVDSNRMSALADRLGYRYDPGNLQEYVTSSADTLLAAQTAVIAARSLGIDSLITNAPHRREPGLFSERLNLPEKFCVPALAVILGYPDAEPEHRRGRFSGPGVVHWDSYTPMSGEELDRMIEDYDTADPQFGLTGDWKEKGYGRYLDFFFDSWMALPRAEEGAVRKERGKIEEYLLDAGYLGESSVV